MHNNRFRSWDQYKDDARKATRTNAPRRRTVANPVIRIDLVALLKARLPREGGDK